MGASEKSYQATHEIGRVYDAITDSKVLIEFFLATLSRFIPVRQSHLFLATRRDKTLLLEASVPMSVNFRGPGTGAGKTAIAENTEKVSAEASAAKVLPDLAFDAQRAYEEGKPCVLRDRMFLPLIARNSVMGVVCLERKTDLPAFSSKEVEIGFDLASEFSGALKNIMLFEENIKMERLAAVGQAMGMVVHEIRNIMQLGRLSDDMIRAGIEEKNRKFLDIGFSKMAKTWKEMDGFIWELLSLTKDYQLEPEKVDLTAILKELRSDLAERAKRYHIKLDFKTEHGFPAVEGDGRSLYRALLNLVKNAFEAFEDEPNSPSENSKVNGASPGNLQSEENGGQGKPNSPSENSKVNGASPGNLQSEENGGQGKKNACVKIRAQIKDADGYELIVEDNASGMSEEVKARIFEAFFSTKGKSGTGLGLMVVARTVKMHQGTVRVESRPGEGTKFILTLRRSFPKEL